MTEIADVFAALNRARVKYLLIGGYASVVHGVPRTTLDIDIALDPDRRNVERTLRAETDHVEDVLA